MSTVNSRLNARWSRALLLVTALSLAAAPTAGASVTPEPSPPVSSARPATAPRVPDPPTSEPSVTVVSETGKAFLRDVTPRLDAVIRDPDSGSVRARFRIRDAETKAEVWRGTSQSLVPGNRFSVWVDVPLDEHVRYRAQVRGLDESSRSRWSAAFVFRVDESSPTTKPGISVVEGEEAEYDEGEFSGGVGQTGAFAFHRRGERDVVRYEYSFDGHDAWETVGVHDAVVSYTPERAGLVDLYVRMVDHANNVGPEREYRFYVCAPGTTSRWQFNDPAGSATAANSAPGVDLPLTVAAAVKWVAGTAYSSPEPYPPGDPDYRDGALQLEGSSDDLVSTDGPVVDTTDSFTVLSYVRLTDASQSRVLFSQDGENTSAFRLEYVADDPGCETASSGCWQFSMPNRDASGPAPTSVRARSALDVPVGQWIMVAGTYQLDRPTGIGELRVWTCTDAISVDGSAPRERSAVPWSSSGDFHVGRALAQGEPTGSFAGDVDEVFTFDDVLTESNLLDQCGGGA